MDHEIEHDADVGAAEGIGGQPVRFDEPGMGEIMLGRLDGRIEPLEMAHLEDEPLSRGRGQQVVRFLQRGGDGLLDEGGDAGLQQRGADRMVPAGRDAHAGRLDLTQQVVEAAHRPAAGLPGHRPGARGVHVVDRHQLGQAGKPGINLGMEGADVADPHDPDPDGQGCLRHGVE